MLRFIRPSAMRLALIVDSPYDRNGRLAALPSAVADGELLERRLSELDAGFQVARFTAERGLAERIEQRLLAQTEPIRELLVYFSGYCVLSEERGPALLLDGERLGTLSLTRLRNLFLLHASAACLIVDAAAVVDAEQSLNEVVASLGGSLTDNAPSVSALVAVRNSDIPDSFGGSGFTGALLMVVDWLASGRTPEQPVDLRWLFDGLRADEQLWKSIPAAGLFGGVAAHFEILPARALPTQSTALPSFATAAIESEALPSFASETNPQLQGAGSSELDALLALAPRFAAIESPTEPARPEFDETDELTPARGTQQLSEPPLPSFGDAALFPEPEADARAAALDPDSSGTRLTPHAAFSGEELARAGQDETALRAFEIELAAQSEPARRAACLARLARVLADLGQAGAAAERFAEAVELDAFGVEVLLVRAEWALAAGDVPNLVASAEALVSLAANDATSLTWLARARREAGHHEAACELYRRVSEHPECSPEILAEARAALTEGRTHGVEARDTLDDRAVVESKAPLPARVSADSGAHEHCAEYEHAIRERPYDVGLRVRVSELYRKLGHVELAVEHCRVATRIDPTQPSVYRLLHTLFDAHGAADGAWNAASVLECLGEADVNEALMVSQHQPEGLLAARTTLGEAEWRHVLLGEAHDSELSALLDALGQLSVRLGIGFAKVRQRYVEPNPEALHDPGKSTTMLAKTLAWSSRLLGLAPPLLYVMPPFDALLQLAPTEADSAFASRALGSGLSLGQLAFLWGRHLPRHRPEFRALSFFRTPAELSSLVEAALAAGGSRAVQVRSLDGDTKRLYAALRRELRGPALARVEAIAQRFDVAGLEARAGRALRELELLGVRSGLVASGDVLLAADLIRGFPGSSSLSREEQLAELYAFAVSGQYASLRARMGVAIAA